MTSLQALLAEKASPAMKQEKKESRKKRKLENSNATQQPTSNNGPTTMATLSRPVPSLNNLLDDDDSKSGFVLWTQIDPSRWGDWIVLGPLVIEKYEVKGKSKPVEKQHIPIWRNPSSLRYPTDAPVPFKMFIKDVSPAFPLKAVTFEESKKASLNYQIELNAERIRLKQLYEAKDAFIKSQMSIHPDLKEKEIDGFRFMPFVKPGKQKPNAPPGERYNSFMRYPIPFNRKKKEFEFLLFREGEEANDDATAQAFLQSDSMKTYKSNIGIVSEKLNMALPQHNIFLNEYVVSINLPEKLPKFTTSSDNVLPGCRLKKKTTD
jgi:hypothetical protein